MYGNFANKLDVRSKNNDYNENETSLNDVNPRTESSHHIRSIDRYG